MIIEKFPTHSPDGSTEIHLTSTIRSGYRAHEKRVEGFDLVHYFGWGATRADAMVNCMSQVHCAHVFPNSQGMRPLKTCVHCGHYRKFTK